MPATQNVENHARFVPAYHMVTFGIFVINFIWCVYQLIHAPSGQTAISSAPFHCLPAALFLRAHLRAHGAGPRHSSRDALADAAAFARGFAPAHREFSVGQLVALRFASDEELPELARKVLDEKIEDRKAIKKLVKNWQPDFLRA